jgi:hypothetical protein
MLASDGRIDLSGPRTCFIVQCIQMDGLIRAVRPGGDESTQVVGQRAARLTIWKALLANQVQETKKCAKPAIKAAPAARPCPFCGQSMVSSPSGITVKHRSNGYSETADHERPRRTTDIPPAARLHAVQPDRLGTNAPVAPVPVAPRDSCPANWNSSAVDQGQ